MEMVIESIFANSSALKAGKLTWSEAEGMAQCTTTCVIHLQIRETNKRSNPSQHHEGHIGFRVDQLTEVAEKTIPKQPNLILIKYLPCSPTLPKHETS
jgi:hypothetical protein